MVRDARDELVEALIEEEVIQMGHLFSAEQLEVLRDLLRDNLETHPVYRRLVAEQANASAADTSDIVPRVKGLVYEDPEAKKRHG